jgi:hypothetical protein
MSDKESGSKIVYILICVRTYIKMYMNLVRVSHSCILPQIGREKVIKAGLNPTPYTLKPKSQTLNCRSGGKRLSRRALIPRASIW